MHEICASKWDLTHFCGVLLYLDFELHITLFFCGHVKSIFNELAPYGAGLNGIFPDLFRLIIWKSRSPGEIKLSDGVSLQLSSKFFMSLLIETTFERCQNKERGTGRIFLYFLMLLENSSNRKQICCRIVQT